MEEREISNIYAIPANYTDSGKLFGGLLEIRNAVETGLLMALMGYPELMMFHMSLRMRIVMMTLTMLPVAVLAMMGIDGDSLFQYISHMIRFIVHKRILHFRRIGYRYEQSGKGKKKKQSKEKKNNRQANEGRQKRQRSSKEYVNGRKKKHEPRKKVQKKSSRARQAGATERRKVQRHKEDERRENRKYQRQRRQVRKA